MNPSDHRSQLIDSLAQLADRIAAEQVPDSILRAIIADNPWFTPYYIERSLQAIATWLKPDLVRDWLQSYDVPPDQPPHTIAIIAAGNVPFVGFHDVLMSLLSGNLAVCKPSRQDRVGIQWLRQQWLEILPSLENFFHLTDQLPQGDFLIATGSNNTARYFQSTYADSPKIIRKNRYSLAVVGPETSEEDLLKLREDVLLYNGLGCRNVSNLVIRPGFELKKWRKLLNSYPQNLTNPLYLERVLHLTAQHKFLQTNAIETDYLHLIPSERIGSIAMGNLRMISIKRNQPLEEVPGFERNEIQCIVGQET
ncbi:MAG: acyl-CoA reductase, partial [Bacteroidota bacterium]